MYIEEVTAAMDREAAIQGVQSILNQIPKEIRWELFKRGIWELYVRTRSRSYKFKIGPIPVSVKVEKLRGVLEWWVGPAPVGLP